MVKRKMSGYGITCHINEYYMEKGGNVDVSICCQDADIILICKEAVLSFIRYYGG